jgi:hypothetical protein
MEAMMILMPRVTQTSKWPHEHSLVPDPYPSNSHHCNVEIPHPTVDTLSFMVSRKLIYPRKRFQERTNPREVNQYSNIVFKAEQIQQHVPRYAQTQLQSELRWQRTL